MDVRSINKPRLLKSSRPRLNFQTVPGNGTADQEEWHGRGNAMFYPLLRTFIYPQQPLRSEFSIMPAYLLRSLMFGWRKFHEGEKEFSKIASEKP